MTHESRNKRLLILLIVLTGAIAAVIFIPAGEGVEFDKSVFKVADLKDVDRVELQTDSSKVVLSYTPPRWLVNETYSADTRMIQVLFATLQQAEPRRPVASSLRDSLSKVLEKTGVTVSLYSGQQNVKRFVVGGNDTKTQSYFRSENGDIFLMTIPGYRVYVSGIFELDESGFRDKLVFGFNWRNFKSLEARFPHKPSENFVVAMGKEYFTIRDMAKVDTAKLNTFLDNVSLLTAETYLPAAVADTLSKKQPQMVIAIRDVADRTYELELFDVGVNNKVKGLINREPVNFAFQTVRPILRQRSFFAKK